MGVENKTLPISRQLVLCSGEAAVEKMSSYKLLERVMGFEPTNVSLGS